MQNLNIKQAAKAWLPLTNFIYVPHNEKEYNRLVSLLDDLIDEVGEEETHPLASMMEILGILIENYETNCVAELTNN